MDKHAGTFIFGHSGPSVNYGELEESDTPYEQELIEQPTFEFLCHQGQKINRSLSDGKWALGDLGVILLATDVGTLGEFAHEIDLAPRTVQNYVAVASFYPPAIRERFAGLHHTHFKTAKQFSHNDLKTACQYLDRAVIEAMKSGPFYTWLLENKTSKETVLLEILGELVGYLEDESYNPGSEIGVLLKRAKAALEA